jgi:hypothetical protein
MKMLRMFTNDSSQLSQNPQDAQSLKLLPLIHNTEFCKLATTVQDKLCATPLISFDEVVQLDAALVKWWQDLPSMLTKDPESSIPSFLRVPRQVMKWQYQNLRMILHRPYLLSFALRKTCYASLTAEEKVAIGKCRLVASKTIEDITSECKQDLISGWHGVVSYKHMPQECKILNFIKWFVYQAAFIPLVSLFADLTKSEETEKWRDLVKTALAFFSRMELYSVTAKKSQDVVSKLLNAAKQAAEAVDAQRRQQEALLKVMAQREQHQQHQRFQQVPSRSHGMDNLLIQNIRADDPQTPLPSPINSFPQSQISPTVGPFNSVHRAMPGILTPAQSVSSHMSQSSLTPTTDYSVLSLHIPSSHPQAQLKEQGHGSSQAALEGLRHIVDPISMNVHQQNRTRNLGFWDDMVWERYPEVDVSYPVFVVPSQWNELGSGNRIHHAGQNHPHWG